MASLGLAIEDDRAIVAESVATFRPGATSPTSRVGPAAGGTEMARSTRRNIRYMCKGGWSEEQHRQQGGIVRRLTRAMAAPRRGPETYRARTFHSFFWGGATVSRRLRSVLGARAPCLLPGEAPRPSIRPRRSSRSSRRSSGRSSCIPRGTVCTPPGPHELLLELLLELMELLLGRSDGLGASPGSSHGARGPAQGIEELLSRA